MLNNAHNPSPEKPPTAHLPANQIDYLSSHAIHARLVAMSVFSKIIAGELPGRFVWADDVCVAFATIEPVQPGHVLIVPRVETDIYVDVDPTVFSHMAVVAQIIGRAQMEAFGVARPVMSLLGFDVPHTHIHVMPANAQADIRQQNARPATDEELDAAMTTLRTTLIAAGHGEHVPPNMYSAQLS